MQPAEKNIKIQLPPEQIINAIKEHAERYGLSCIIPSLLDMERGEEYYLSGR